MSKRPSRKIAFVLCGFALAGVWGGGLAHAGPARYDPEKRSIRLTYTFAALADGLFGEAAIGAPQTPTSDQDAVVRTVTLKVSDALSKATAGRLKVASLDLASDVKRADIVISLTSKPARGGWAMAGAIEGRPGQIGLFYQTLAAELEQDQVLTAAHEVCHYIFGLVDEYNFPSGCPVVNPSGPGCLMDNYLLQGTRHGWYGRFCNDDHSTNAAQRQSCQQIVDKFFQDRNVTTTGPANDADQPSATSADPQLEVRASKVDNIKQATVGLLRERFQAQVNEKKGNATLSLINSFKGEAEKFLTTQLGLNQVTLSTDEKRAAIETVLKTTASVAKFAIPPRFDPMVDLISKFARDKAKQLRDESPKDSEATRKRKIAAGLLTFVGGLGGVGNAPVAGGNLTAEEKKFLDQIAQQAARVTDQREINEQLVASARAHIELSREIASNLLDVAGETGVVGMQNRLAAFNEIDARLGRYLPGRTASSGFGRRRTIIIDPDPLDPASDYVITQSGIHRYSDLRDQNVDLFSKLVERARIELLSTERQKARLRERRELLAKPADMRAREEQVRRLAELSDRNRVRAQREAELRATLAELGQQIRNNRLENIVFMVPPGGLPRDINALFEGLRRTLIVQGDVRLDIVMTGPDEIPFELRDIAVGSGGSIYTIADVDEVGAVAQRLKNDQASGSWVILPHQDEIRGPRADLDATTARKDQRWVRNDTKGGGFRAGQSPIDFPYLDVQSRIARIYDYFIRHGKSNENQAIKSFSENDLDRAGIMSPDAIDALSRTVQNALLGSSPTTGRSMSDVLRKDDAGLTDEIAILYKIVKDYNDRNTATGTGVAMRSNLIEHVLRARVHLQTLRSAIEIALEAHRNFLAPDFDEERVLREAYGRFERAYDAIEPAVDDPQKFSELEKRTKVWDAITEVSTAVDFGETDMIWMFSLNTGDEASKPANRSLIDSYSYWTLKPILSSIIGQENAALVINARTAKDDPKTKQAVHITEGYFWKNYPDKIRINLILANFDREWKTRGLFDRPEVKLDGLKPEQIVDELKRIAERDIVLKQAAPTIAYIALRMQEVRLRSVQEFLDHIERDLSVAEDVPLSRRIDRRALVLAMERLQDAEPGRVDATGRNRPRPMAPVDTFIIEGGVEKRRPGTYRLPRFYAENILFDPKRQLQAEFELIVGLARPLPGIDLSALRDNRTEVLPELRLYNDNGQLVNTPSLRLDRDLSTPTCLVYHFAPEFKEEGWYTGALILKESTFRLIGSDVINFTFSVASTRPNFRLNSALVQMPNDPELIPPPANRGLLRVMDRRARIEVQVYGGTSVLSASVRGVLYKIGVGADSINPIGQSFYDDGETSGDRKGGDGVYTTLIPLDVIEKGMEYRVLLQADSTDQSRNIAPEDPNAKDEERRALVAKQKGKKAEVDPIEKVVVPAPEKAEVFQRASSIQIRVER